MPRGAAPGRIPRRNRTEEGARTPRLAVLAVAALVARAALAQQPRDVAKRAAGGAAVSKLQRELNRRLLDESRRNQCSFRSDSDVLEPGCDAKARRLARALVDAKKRLDGAGVKNFEFVVSGHTDATGHAAHNEELSGRRAAVLVRERVARGVPRDEIDSVGMGAERPLVRPDDTPAKRARNRRYEVQVRL